MHGACRCALAAFAEAIADMALAASAAFLSIRLDLCPRPRAHPAGFQPGTSGLSVALAPADERTLHLSHRSNSHEPDGDLTTLDPDERPHRQPERSGAGHRADRP